MIELPNGFCILRSADRQCLLGPGGDELARLDAPQENDDAGQWFRREVLVRMARRAAKRGRKGVRE